VPSAGCHKTADASGRSAEERPAVGGKEDQRWGDTLPGRPKAEGRRSEIRVLRYLPTNLSAVEIARELSLSVNTVRTYTRHLFAKLGTHRRTESVERARALGLLAPSSRRR
jgi:DNA-binding CsgD family transcriptional regulator